MEIDTNVKRNEVEVMVRELMVGSKGNKMREKVDEWKKKAKMATMQGGTSYDNFNRQSIKQQEFLQTFPIETLWYHIYYRSPFIMSDGRLVDTTIIEDVDQTNDNQNRVRQQQLLLQQEIPLSESRAQNMSSRPGPCVSSSGGPAQGEFHQQNGPARVSLTNQSDSSPNGDGPVISS
ncbi:hypothetical protein M9H77_31276 [Catharanthus roseus]|uniref:Uncharacterized protein n=1 Tax=Catharanthus roseus TaxID=4058 RepID=A0ACC0A1P9_CATRO|nr:hypothetical protein M9H77_31276 [Catharanthus roseus]